MKLPEFDSEPALYTCLKRDERLAGAMARIGPYRLNGRDGRTPYEALVRAIVGQQLHSRAVEAIFGRLCALTGHLTPSPHQILAFSDHQIRACGISGAKLLALRGLAQATLTGQVPSLEEAEKLSDDDLVQRLVSLRGIGRWTVEMMLIFSLGREDVLPVNDFGVRAGWQKLYALERPLTPALLRKETLRFAPHRTALAWYLWRMASEGRTMAGALNGGEGLDGNNAR